MDQRREALKQGRKAEKAARGDWKGNIDNNSGLKEDFRDACRKGGGRLETMQQGKRNTHQCITDHGKLDLDLYNKERIPNEVTGQSISSENNPVKMKGRVKNPDTAYYDRNNNRIVVGTKDGNKLSIHNDKHKDDDNKGEYY